MVDVMKFDGIWHYQCQQLIIDMNGSLCLFEQISWSLIKLLILMDQQKIQWKLKNSFPSAQDCKPAKQAIGDETVKFPISTFTEFDPIKCVIIGYIDNTARLSPEFEYPPEINYSVKMGPFPEEYITRAQQNLNQLSEALLKMGINVVRVGEYDFSKLYSVCGVETPGFCNFSPRDYPFLYHDSFYGFPMTLVCNNNIDHSFEWIEKELHEKGSKIYETWQPICEGLRYQISPEPLNQKIYQKQDEYFGDAANLLKVGLDILFSLSISASRGCFLKLRELMQKRYRGTVRVHLMDIPENYDNFHVDTTISIIGWNKKIGKNIVVVNGEKTKPSTIPAIFRGKNWALIELSKFDQQYQDKDYQYISEAIGMNFLTVNPELLVISDKQVRMKQILNLYGIQCLALENKHSAQLAGGFHCVTNDICREDVHKFGQIIEKDPRDLTLEERAGLFDPQLLKFLQSKGSIDEWVKICNQNNIFPLYLTEHLSNEQKSELELNHKKDIDEFRLK